MAKAARREKIEIEHASADAANAALPQKSASGCGDFSHGSEVIIGRPGRLRLQRRVSALCGLAALLVGYGLAVTLVLTLF